jgi:hypothetical protein
MTFFDGSQEHSITPTELNFFVFIVSAPRSSGVFRSKKVHHISLLTQIDSDKLFTALASQVLNERCLSNTGRSFDQNGFIQRVRSQEFKQVELCSFGLKDKLGLDSLIFVNQKWLDSDFVLCVDKFIFESHGSFQSICTEKVIQDYVQICSAVMHYSSLLIFTANIDSQANSIDYAEFNGMSKSQRNGKCFTLMQGHKLDHAQNVTDRECFPVESEVLARKGKVDKTDNVENSQGHGSWQAFVFANLGDD